MVAFKKEKLAELIDGRNAKLEFALCMDISMGMVYQWLAGTVTPNLGRIAQMAICLKVPPKDFIDFG